MQQKLQLHDQIAAQKQSIANLSECVKSEQHNTLVVVSLVGCLG